MEREKIIEKIKKLREHSVENGCNEAEAIQFALKAQKLIADNDVEEWELADEVKRVTETEGCKASRPWAQSLLAVVAENFRCRAYMQKATMRSRSWKPVFVGYKADSEAAALVFEHLLKTGDRLGHEYEDFAYTDSNAYTNFTMGFVLGVKSELEKQSFELMIVCPKEVDDYMEGLNLKTSKSRGPRTTNTDSISRGMQQGRDAVRSRRVEAPRGNLLPA